MSGYPEDALAEVPNFSVQRDFLAKPFKPADLERRVAEAVGGGSIPSAANAANAISATSATSA
jgi:hypothetical protein